MDNPPPLPDKKPLGRTFFILLLAPIGLMALAAAASFVDHANLGDFGVMLSWGALLGMLTCSIICAVMAGKRWGGWMGFLMFVGIQVLYIGVSIAGCATVMSGMNFH